MDGKVLLVDKDWVDELYPDGIYPGKQLELPWTGKKGNTVMWNAVIQCKKPHMEDQQDDQPKSLKAGLKVKQTKSKIPSKKEKDKLKGNLMCGLGCLPTGLELSYSVCTIQVVTILMVLVALPANGMELIYCIGLYT